MAEVKYGQPCPSKAPDGTACVWPRSHKNDHRDGEMDGRCWTGGIRTAPRWRCPRGFRYAPCGTCPTCIAGAAPASDRATGGPVEPGVLLVGTEGTECLVPLEPNQAAEECPRSQRVDGKLHSWRFDGDDPHIICVYCDEMRDAIDGRVLRRGAGSPQPAAPIPGTEDTCIHCRQRIVLVNFAIGPSWMHQHAAASFADARHEYCHTTTATPNSAALAVSKGGLA